MKRIFIILLALTLAFAAVACESAKGGADPTKAPYHAGDIELHPIDPASLFDDNFTGEAEFDKLTGPTFVEGIKRTNTEGGASYYCVFTDYEHFKAFARRETGRLEEVNEQSFISNFVVAVVITVNTGGYTFEVDKAENDGDTVTVNVKVNPPTADYVTEALETYMILVGFDAGDLYDTLNYNVTVNGRQIQPGGAQS